MMPISLDIETSGVDKVRCGIWQIGAIDLNNPKEQFLEEARIDDEDIVTESALKVIGKTKQELRDSNKQSQKQLLENFFKWVNERPAKNFLCQNPQFDVAFLEIKAKKYGLEIPFSHRSFDSHSIAQTKYFDINNRFLFFKDTNNSAMNLSNMLNLCGIPDERRIFEGGEQIKEGKPHNALEDAKLTAECFSRLIYGKNLFPEYAQFKIPENFVK